MAIIGYNFVDIKASRNSNVAVAQKGLEVNHSISIKNVEKTPLNMASGSSEVLKVEFDFSVLYQEVGSVTLKGDAIFSDTKEIVEESFTSWKQDKKLPQMVDLEIRRFVYTKSLMQAMNLSDLLNLPAPIPLPKFEVKKSE